MHTPELYKLADCDIGQFAQGLDEIGNKSRSAAEDLQLRILEDANK
jgi:hypothetical protein